MKTMKKVRKSAKKTKDEKTKMGSTAIDGDVDEASTGYQRHPGLPELEPKYFLVETT